MPIIHNNIHDTIAGLLFELLFTAHNNTIHTNNKILLCLNKVKISTGIQNHTHTQAYINANYRVFLDTQNKS